MEVEEVPTCTDVDRQLNEIDKIYGGFARACGISECAFWMMFDTVNSGGEVALSWLNNEWYYSKQTINSALKTLTAKNMVELDFAEGSRKKKVVRLTQAGRAFAERYIDPALEAESRAFAKLEPHERIEMLRMLKKFASALSAEVDTFTEQVAQLPATQARHDGRFAG